MTAPALANPYEVLGVSRQATPAEIRRAWLDAIKRTHPDRARTEDERLRLEELASELNAAYHAVKDPDRRADVDAELRYAEAAAQPTFSASSFTASSVQDNSYRADQFSPPGLRAFLVHDRAGQWLVSLTWLGALSWVISPYFKLDSATWLFIALVGLGLQVIVAHRLEHTPLHDLMRVANTVATTLARLLIEVARASAKS